MFILNPLERGDFSPRSSYGVQCSVVFCVFLKTRKSPSTYPARAALSVHVFLFPTCVPQVGGARVPDVVFLAPAANLPPRRWRDLAGLFFMFHCGRGRYRAVPLSFGVVGTVFEGPFGTGH